MVKKIKLTDLLCGPYWGCAARKGPFLNPISVAKGLILAEPP